MGCAVGFFLYPQFDFDEGRINAPALTAPIQISACFSPEGHCTSRIVSAIDSAKTSILVQAYSFTSPPIAQALTQAYERGLDVRVIIDKSRLSEKHSQIPLLSQKGIPIFIDPAVGIGHNKTIILDNSWVLTGSFNWSMAAENKNAENILFIEDPSLAQIYKKNWENRANTARNAITETKIKKENNPFIS